EEFLTLSIGGLPVDERYLEPFGNIFELFDISADDQYLLISMLIDDVFNRCKLRISSGCNPVPVAIICRCVDHALFLCLVDEYLHEISHGNIAGVLLFYPRIVINV